MLSPGWLLLGLVHSGIVGQYVLPSIQGATKSIDIVSPYLSPEYAQLLISRAEQGIIVRLITSDANNHRHQQALRTLRTDAYILGRRFWRYLIVAVVLGLFGVMFGSYQGLMLISLAGIMIVIAITKNLPRQKRRNIPLYVKVISASQLVHLKLYIVDQQVALVGSANLTYYGMNRNIERIEIKTTPSEVQPEIGVFANLWGAQQTSVVPSTVNPSIPRPVQHQDTDTVLTREEAEILEKLYGKKKP